MADSPPHYPPAAAPDDEAFLRLYLADRDVPCPRCGYNLRQLSSDRCPECGDQLTLRVGLADGHQWAYAVLLVAWAIGFGGAALFSVVAALYAPRRWWMSAGAIMMLVQVATSAAGLVASLVGRRRFRRADSVVQRRLAVAACVVVLLLSGIVVGTFKD